MADEGSYTSYADEICALAQFYYYEGHLYDNVFTWTSANGEKVNKYRTSDRWDWWGDTEPSMAPIEEKPPVTTTTTTSTTTTTTTTTTVPEKLAGDVNTDGTVNTADIVKLQCYLLKKEGLNQQQYENAELDGSEGVTSLDLVWLRKKVIELNR